MMNNKKIILLIVVVVLFGAVLYLFNLSTPVSQPLGQSQNAQAVIDKVGTPPLVVVGIVSKIEGQNITITVRTESGTEEKVIIVNDKTQMTKQVKENESFKISPAAPATFDDIKLKLRLIVAYNQSSDAGYIADNINILNF